MILIISINNDPLTVKIGTWLLHLKKDFKIITLEDEIKVLKISEEIILLKNLTKDYEIDIHKVTSMLFRQGGIRLSKRIPESDDFQLNRFLESENRVLIEFIFHHLTSKKRLGHLYFSDVNKLIVLKKANDIGLSVPEYIYTGVKKDLIIFKERYNEIITKPIQPAFYFQDDFFFKAAYTEEITSEEIRSLSEKFHPTFFQRLIPKKYDIRVFYLLGVLYSIAIVSQKNEQTKIDYRNYDKSLPNRQIPFKIPPKTEEKLIKLLDIFNLGYCSIDLIYGQDNNLYFLEINPVGQFGVVSEFGNHYLEKKIAEIL